MLPLDFLSEENLQPPTLAKEGIVPTVTWTWTTRQQTRDYGYHPEYFLSLDRLAPNKVSSQLYLFFLTKWSIVRNLATYLQCQLFLPPSCGVPFLTYHTFALFCDKNLHIHSEQIKRGIRFASRRSSVSFIIIDRCSQFCCWWWWSILSNRALELNKCWNISSWVWVLERPTS